MGERVCDFIGISSFTKSDCLLFFCKSSQWLIQVWYLFMLFCFVFVFHIGEWKISVLPKKLKHLIFFFLQLIYYNGGKELLFMSSETNLRLLNCLQSISKWRSKSRHSLNLVLLVLVRLLISIPFIFSLLQFFLFLFFKCVWLLIK